MHRGQVAVDPKARCIVACLGEQADGHEGDAVAEIYERTRFHCPELASVGADQGFAAERVWAGLERRGLSAFIPPQRTMLAKDGEPRSEAQRQALRARERCQSEAGVWAHKRRIADAEGVIAELKTRGTLARARCRGTSLFHIQLLLDSAAVNMKRLADHAGQAAEGRAAGPATGTVIDLAGAQAACSGPNGRGEATEGAGSRIEALVVAPLASVWSFGVSLN